jgi:hypothetical protein
MSGKRDAAAAALYNVRMLHQDFHAPILHELDAAGLLDNQRVGNGGQVRAAAVPARECITAMQAMGANPDNGIRIKRVVAEAARLGYEIRLNEKIDTFALDQALKGKDVEQRMRLKRNLAAMNLIA